MLHIISNITPAILNRINQNDAVICLENAVLYLLKNNIHQEKLNTLKQLYVLNEHIVERGLLKQDILEHIIIINYAEFVELTLKHYPIQSWT